MAEELEKGMGRQSDAEEKGRTRDPEAPGTYAGLAAEGTPEWLGKGLPRELGAVFEACPAWMPDIFGHDRTAHAYAGMLRDLRGGLLEKPENRPEAGNRRQWTPRPVTRRAKA